MRFESILIFSSCVGRTKAMKNGRAATVLVSRGGFASLVFPQRLRNCHTERSGELEARVSHRVSAGSSAERGVSSVRAHNRKSTRHLGGGFFRPLELRRLVLLCGAQS